MKKINNCPTCSFIIFEKQEKMPLRLARAFYRILSMPQRLW
jgi:hypothetical protein